MSRAPIPVRTSIVYQGRTIEVFGHGYPGRAAYTSGLPEHCYPGEDPELDVRRAVDTETQTEIELTTELLEAIDKHFHESPGSFRDPEDDYEEPEPREYHDYDDIPF